MIQQSLTTANQNRRRWIFAVATPIISAILIFLLVQLPEPSAIPAESPPLYLEYVDVTEKVPEKEPETPPTRVITTTSPKTPTKETVTPLADMEPSVNDNSPATVTTTVKPQEPSKPAGSSGEPRTVSIESATQLDNTSYEPIYNPKPNYPTIPQSQGITGYVDLDLSIDEKGKVKEFTILKSYGHPTFGEETAKVITRWKFPPPRIGGKPVRVIYQYRVYFRLN